MSILTERKNDVAESDLELEALVEFLKQDIKPAQPQNASNREHALLNHIMTHDNLRFMLSEGSDPEPLPTRTAEADPILGNGPKKAPISELSPQTKKQARKARTRKAAPIINTVVLFAFWALLLSVVIRFVDFPLNYILGAVFILPTVLMSVPLLRNAKHQLK